MAKIKHTNVGTGIETLEEWMGENLHEVVGGGEIVSSNPPEGCKKVVNIYYDPQLAKYVIQREE